MLAVLYLKFKMKTTTYHIQNRIQKEVMQFIRIFKHDFNKVNQLEDRGIKIYTPKLNKIKVFIGVAFTIVCLLTPFTNFLIPLNIMWVIK